MQRWSTGQRRRKHGLQETVSRIKVNCSVTGAVPSGSVEPKIPITGRPAAAATCMAPESLPINTEQEANSAARSRMDVSPDQRNRARFHVRANAGCNFLFPRRAKKYHIGAAFRNQAIRERRETLRRPAFCRAVGSARRNRAAPCIFPCARFPQRGLRGRAFGIGNEQADRRDCRRGLDPSRAMQQFEIVVRFVLGDLPFPRHLNRPGEQRAASVPRIPDSFGNARAPREPRGIEGILQEHGDLEFFLLQLARKPLAAEPSRVPSTVIVWQNSVRERLSRK